MQTLWMEIDLDFKELPIRVCATAQELAKEAGVSPATVFSSNFRYENGISRSKFIRVVVPDDSDYDD